ncbi:MULTISPECIES: hypothetical protein [Prauserella salsuginis group]|uniref:DUF4352 domain-containing protein n=2 Tax=Prauserella salsuginis group TaxID=2893672 RepID=A0A839XKR8_9PSEU|nr:MULTISPECIES: hypothetical protein [Prauserella salsuginis group]MBB3661318.1 hypothetical protein [Prauserella sediminis]MCR3719240.1 hypothetical protein [Prauserella flava]MCR3735747.1 hypothetical protein [Prauserella salsuginis]
MRKGRPALAVCALLLALTGCGAEPTAPEGGAAVPPGTTSRAAASQTSAHETPARPAVLFGGDYRFGSGLIVNVSEPKTFTPSDSAFPDADRAAAFTLTVRNETDKAYRLSQLSVRATSGDERTPQVVDPTQGYTGIVDAERDLPAGDRIELPYAFAVPAHRGSLELTVCPDTSGADEAIYHGQV